MKKVLDVAPMFLLCFGAVVCEAHHELHRKKKTTSFCNLRNINYIVNAEEDPLSTCTSLN